MTDEEHDRCPQCGHVFPHVVAVGVKPDTVTGITDFAVVVECPACMAISQWDVPVDQMGRGEPLPVEALQRKKEPSRDSN